MMSVDLSKIKPGDEVTVRGIVTGAENNGWPCLLIDLKLEGGIERDTNNGKFIVSAGYSAIVTHTPKALSVGDRVRKLVLDLDEQGAQRIYKITAIDDDGWMLLADRGPSARVTTSRDFVERIP